MIIPLRITATSPFPEMTRKALELFSSKRIHQRGALAMRELTQRHLLILNATRANRLGGARTNFYGKFAKSSNLVVEATDAKGELLIGNADFGGISGKNALAHKLTGGPIEAIPGKALAIPVHPDAYGRAPRSFDNLRLIVFGPKKTAVLAAVGGEAVEHGQTTKARKKKGSATVLSRLTVMYLLLKRVITKPDPTALPTDEDYGLACAIATQNLVTEACARMNKP